MLERILNSEDALWWKEQWKNHRYLVLTGAVLLIVWWIASVIWIAPWVERTVG